MTIIRFLPSVNAHMGLQIIILSRPISTIRTRKRFFSGVSPHVSYEISGFLCAVCTVGAPMKLSRVGKPVTMWGPWGAASAVTSICLPYL